MGILLDVLAGIIIPIHFLPHFQTSSVNLEALRNSKCFALSTNKELEKYSENRQIQGHGEGQCYSDLQARATSIRGVSFDKDIKFICVKMLGPKRPM